MKRKSPIWYTVYEAYMDHLVVIGSAKECASYFGCTDASFRSMVAKVKSGLNRAYCVVVEDLDSGSYTVYGANNTGDLRGRPKMVDDDIAWKMYLSGSTDTKIAERIGVNFRTIWDWRQKNNLPANSSRGRPRKVVA